MADYDNQSESFIIRIWREPRELEGAPVLWRGELEHVTSHTRHFFRDFDVLVALMQSYLLTLGVNHRGPDTAADED